MSIVWIQCIGTWVSVPIEVTKRESYSNSDLGGRLNMIIRAIIFFRTSARFLLIDVNRIFLIDRSVIRSKVVDKKNEREKQFVSTGNRLEKRDAFFFRRCFCASLAASSFLVFYRRRPWTKEWRFDERRQVWLVKLRGSPLTVTPFRITFLEEVLRRCYAF